MPWRLAAPISREVVLAMGTPRTLVLAGGLVGGTSTADGAYRLNTVTGKLSLIGALASGSHDAAGTVLGGQGLVLGGGTQLPSQSAQDLSAGGASRLLKPLPQARADAAAVTIGTTAYVVGGYNGASLDPQVLATADGETYRTVATLPVPVRYPAVAALGSQIYVFGGEASDGRPVDDIQVVVPAKGTARVVGHLPAPVWGGAAAVLGGTIYLAGGTTGHPGALRVVGNVYAFDEASMSVLQAGRLPVATTNAGAAGEEGRLFIIGGETAGGAQTADVQFVRPDAAFGRAGIPGAGSPFFGERLLVADRGNNRLLLLNDQGQVTWTYPSRKRPPPPGGFYFPDDAFFIRKGTAIISNQEENETLVEIGFPSGRILWSYGHPHQAGSAPGYLNNPDDAYLMRDGKITVADPMNCRVLIIDPRTKKVLLQIGTVGGCAHNPPTEVGSPNGDTPLADGDLLISEINGSWVDEYTTAGKLVWAAQLPIGYPSDPQQLGPDRYLVADYERPGAILEFNRAGHVLYRFQPASGPAELDHPSLAELLPSGVFMLNDDYNDRMVAIDPATGAVVWQYGQTGVPGTAAGLLNKPDGFDVIGPGGTTPTHTATG